MSDTEAPSPGSDEAAAKGCTCPRIDNAHGRGAFGGSVKGADGKTVFWTNDACPLHGTVKAPPPARAG